MASTNTCPMAVLVFGATGFIGPRVVRALDAFDVEIAAASRNGGGAHGIALDRRNVERVRAFVRERRITTIVDLLAYTEADTLPLFAALDGEVARWVMASSCDVYRNYDGLHRKAAPEPTPAPLDETAPLRTLRHPYRRHPRRPVDAPDAWWDDYDKIPLEQALRERRGLGGVILRLPMIYGPGDLQRRFAWIIAPMLKSEPRLVVDPAWARWRTTYGYVDDVAHALAIAAIHAATPERTFNIGEKDAPDHLAWISRFADALAWNGKVDLAGVPKDGPFMGLNFAYSLAINSQAFRAACDWHEPTGLRDALSNTIADEKRRG